MLQRRPAFRSRHGLSLWPLNLCLVNCFKGNAQRIHSYCRGCKLSPVLMGTVCNPPPQRGCTLYPLARGGGVQIASIGNGGEGGVASVQTQLAQHGGTSGPPLTEPCQIKKESVPTEICSGPMSQAVGKTVCTRGNVYALLPGMVQVGCLNTGRGCKMCAIARHMRINSWGDTDTHNTDCRVCGVNREPLAVMHILCVAGVRL